MAGLQGCSCRATPAIVGWQQHRRDQRGPLVCADVYVDVDVGVGVGLISRGLSLRQHTQLLRGAWGNGRQHLSDGDLILHARA